MSERSKIEFDKNFNFDGCGGNDFRRLRAGATNAFGAGVPYKFPHSPDTGPGLTNLGKELVRECNRFGIMIDLAHINEKGFWDVAKLSNAPLVVTHSNVHAYVLQQEI